MPTSNFMPDFVVDVAFNAGFRTPAASRVWTDVSAYVELAEGVSVNGGRADERSTADANTLSLTLDNSDGRFTAGKIGALVLNGVSPGRASTPDTAALDITGDIDIRVHVALDDWTPAAPQILAAKWSTGQQSWRFGVLSAGTLNFTGSTDGSNFAIAATSTVATGFTDGTEHWARITVDVDNGAGGRDMKFYTSTDGVSWTQLGSTVTQAGVVAIFAGSAEVAVGARQVGTVEPLAGRVFSAEIRNGIAGTIVANPDFRAQTTGATSFADSTGKTWTIVSPATLDGAPYYPNVKLYRPIRVRATPVDGAQQTLFTGYVTSWPVEWDGTSAYASATVTASSRLSRLGLNAEWRSIVEETILVDEPAAYYPLGEPEGATQANDVSGNGAAPLLMVGEGTAVVFGSATGPGTDDLTAATFAGGKYLSGGVTDGVEGFLGLRLALQVTTYPTATIPIATVNGVGTVTLNLSTTGAITVTSSSGTFGTGSVPADGSVHDIVLSWSTFATTSTLYVDGSAAGTGDASMGSSRNLLLEVGGPGGASGTVPGLTGVLSHVALYDGDPTTTSGPSSTRVTAMYQAVSTGFAGETTKARLERYAALADILAAEVSAEAGSTTMAHVDTTGQNVVDMLRTCETTEGGVLFDARDGTLTMHNRAHRYNRATSVTLDMAKHEVEADYSPRMDPSGLANDITAANTAGTVTANVKDATSIGDNGSATMSITTASQSTDEPLQLASWAKAKHATPRPRVPSLTVNALAQVGKTTNCAAVMAVDIGDKITVTNHPAQAAAPTVSYFVEGYTFSIGPERFEITWNVSPASPDTDVWILGDATRGVLESTTMLAL